jgi:hypothetical protein
LVDDKKASFSELVQFLIGVVSYRGREQSVVVYFGLVLLKTLHTEICIVELTTELEFRRRNTARA